MLLKRFAESDRTFFKYNIRTGAIAQTNIDSSFLRNHLYSIQNGDGLRDASLEHSFAILERRADAILNDIIPEILTGTYPALTSERRMILSLFTYQQWRRVPEFHESLIGDDFFAGLVFDAFAEFETRYRPITDEERATYTSTQALARLRQRAKVNSLRDIKSETLSDIQRKGLFFGIAPPRAPIVISSFPVLKIIPPGSGSQLYLPSVEVWLPIHSRIMMAFAHHPSGEATMNLTSRQVMDYNMAVAERSSEFASSDRSAVERVCRKLALPRAPRG